MQLYADVLRLPISTIGSEQGPALGVGDPCRRRRRRVSRRARGERGHGTRSSETSTSPTSARADVYDRLYAEYRLLHDHFGRGANDVMKRLKDLRREVVA